jgi:hypothetical protein
MSLTITFPSDLAQRLQTEASQRQVSVEELAATILDRAVPYTDAWSGQNQRRLALIRKSIRESLTSTEQKELDALQATLDARFDNFDAALKSQLDLMRSAVE